MPVAHHEAAKLAAEMLQAALSAGSLKLYGMTGNMGEPSQNAAADGEYLAAVYKVVYAAIRDT